LGFGVSAIGRVGPTYVQNHRELDDYYESVNSGALPVARGIALSNDDVIRRSVIMSLMCQFGLEKPSLRNRFGIDFDVYFRDELESLDDLVLDGLVELHPDRIRVTPQGRFLVRAIAMRFDAGLKHSGGARRYSKIV
jgi:oxygen-independent coproporphyrinogen-3 oxidase